MQSRQQLARQFAPQSQRSGSAKAIADRDYTARKVALVIALALMSYVAMMPILQRLGD